MWLMLVSAAPMPVSAGVVCSAGGVDSVVVVSELFWPHPTAARAMVSDRTATIARANSLRIFTLHLPSNSPRPNSQAAARNFSYAHIKDTTEIAVSEVAASLSGRISHGVSHSQEGANRTECL